MHARRHDSGCRIRTFWFGAYWLMLGAMLVYLFRYAGRVLLILRQEPRSRATAHLYPTWAGFGVAATVIHVDWQASGRTVRGRRKPFAVADSRGGHAADPGRIHLPCNVVRVG